MTVVISVLILGWLLASAIGTCAYFANEPMTEESARS
ncbi:MAG: endonuclease [Xenococcus sp. (in: cyanobacteria)]